MKTSSFFQGSFFFFFLFSFLRSVPRFLCFLYRDSTVIRPLRIIPRLTTALRLRPSLSIRDLEADAFSIFSSVAARPGVIIKFNILDTPQLPRD